jgi:hypothetical protein
VSDILRAAIALAVLSVAARIAEKPLKWLLKKVIIRNAFRLLKNIVTRHYVHKAERRFPGPQRGPEKKDFVAAKLDKWEAGACEAADELIETVVSAMNAKKDTAVDDLKDAVEDKIDEIKGE